MERGKQHDKPSGYVDPQLEPMQRIEGGGPIKRVDVNTLPGWLRVGYYVVVAILLGMLIFGVYASYFK